MQPTHAEQRLLQRTSRAAMDNGFALMRDRPALAALIEEVAAGDASFSSSDRCAFAVEGGDECAHVVVARDGSPVTVLARGMAFTCPRVPWPRVERFLREQAELLRARRVLASVDQDDEHTSPLHRYGVHPHRLVRDEWDVLRALDPLVGDLYDEGVILTLRQLTELGVSLQRRAPPMQQARAEAFWRIYVGGTVSCSLLLDKDRADAALLLALCVPDALISARALWSLVHRPATTLAAVERSARKIREPEFARDASLLLMTIAARHPGYAKDAQRTQAALFPDITCSVVSAKTLRRAATMPLPHMFRALCPNVSELLDDKEIDRRVGAVEGDDVAAYGAAAGPWHAEILELWRPFAEEGAPPRLQPRRESALTDADRLSLKLWRYLFRHHTSAPTRTTWLAPLLALAPVEALVPGDAPDPSWRLSDGADYCRELLPEILTGFAKFRPQEEKPQPAKAAKKQEPNAPCACGSGKKFKKCHGGPNPPA